MDIFDIITILMVFSALFSYLNYRYFHLPRSVGLMLALLILSSTLVVAWLPRRWKAIRLP